MGCEKCDHSLNFLGPNDQTLKKEMNNISQQMPRFVPKL
jgi:hypothetical protein